MGDLSLDPVSLSDLTLEEGPLTSIDSDTKDNNSCNVSIPATCRASSAPPNCVDNLNGHASERPDRPEGRKNTPDSTESKPEVSIE